MTSTPSCKECGRQTQSYRLPILDGGELKAAGHNPNDFCKECWYWLAQIYYKPEDRAVYDGQHYRIKPDLPTGYPKTLAGHSGARFVLNFTNGSVRYTENLWHQGEIPARFRDRLPDNVTALEGASRKGMEV